MKRKGLTPTEVRVLREMASGNVLRRCAHTTLAAGISYFLSRQMETVRSTTAKSLLDRGLIEDYEKPEWRWRGSHYRLTEAGKDFLRAWGRGEEAK